MKITDKSLGILYRSYVHERSLAPGQTCPNPEDLISIFNPRARKKRKTHIIDHITRCSACTNEFHLFLEIERERRQFESEIGRALSESRHLLKKKDRFAWKDVHLAGILAICDDGRWDDFFDDELSDALPEKSHFFFEIRGRPDPISTRYSTDRARSRIRIEIASRFQMALYPARELLYFRTL